MSIRCKFRCDSVERFAEASSIKLHAVTDGSSENKQFFKWTPSGQLAVAMVNQEAAAQFEPGKDYYIDITPAAAP